MQFSRITACCSAIQRRTSKMISPLIGRSVFCLSNDRRCRQQPAAPSLLRTERLASLQELPLALTPPVLPLLDHHPSAREHRLRPAEHLLPFVAGVVDVHVVRL